jgi:hypothetical protein
MRDVNDRLSQSALQLRVTKSLVPTLYRVVPPRFQYQILRMNPIVRCRDSVELGKVCIVSVLMYKNHQQLLTETTFGDETLASIPEVSDSTVQQAVHDKQFPASETKRMHCSPYALARQ